MSAERWWSGQERGWRYLACRVLGDGQQGAWLDTELPLTDVVITDVLSGPPQLTATITPVYYRLLARDGRPLLSPYQTAIFAEADGVIRGGGLLVATSQDGPDLGIEVSGYTGYATGMAYESDTAYVETDPLVIVRHIWSHIQAGQRSNLGLVVDQTTTTPVRVGKPDPATLPATFATFRFRPRKLRNATAANSVQIAEFELRAGGHRVSTAAAAVTANNNGVSPAGEEPARAVDNNLATKWLSFNEVDNVWLTVAFPEPVSVDGYRIAVAGDAIERDPVSWTMDASDDGGTTWVELSQVDDYATPTTRAWTEDFPVHAPEGTNRSPDDGPYLLNAWETDDLGGRIDDLAESTPFDYHEEHGWNADKTAITHSLRFGYPSLGRRRTDLRFVYGENIQSVPSVGMDGEEFANHVRVIGAGEGSAAIREEARVNDGRLRRMVVIDDKAIVDANRARQRARDELARRQNLTTVTDVVVRNHPNAPLGSFTVGDEIRVQAETDWVAVDLWFRVLSVTITPDNPELMGLQLLRSDWAVA